LAKSDQTSESPTPTAHELTPERLFALASPAVVKIIVKDEDGREIGQGSGFVVEAVWTESGLFNSATVVTNYHVIRPAVHVDVVFGNGQTGPAFLVLAEDESADVAVLITMAKRTVAPSSPAESLPRLEVRNSENPPIGARVYVIGTPQGLANTLSEGLVSGYRERTEHAVWIQITAPISLGSSGGPVLSGDGTVLGRGCPASS
jgi:S1-C subfamily serine protease